MMAATVTSEDNILVETILAKHNPDGKEYYVKPIFLIVEDALSRSTLSFEAATRGGVASVKHLGHTNMLKDVHAKIERISSEISFKTLNGVDAHSTTVAIFDILTMYKWDVKIVLALAAFTLIYGDFWLLAHIHDTYQLAKALAILKQLPSIMENASSLKPRFDTLNDLVNIILEVTKCVIEFHDLPIPYNTQDITAYTTAYKYIPVACYWTVRSIVACTSLITRLTTHGLEIFTSTDTWELSTLTFKLKNIINLLRQLLDNCCEYINKQTEMISTRSASTMDDEAHPMLRGLFDLFLTPQTDNMKVLEALINAQEDTLPLYDGVTRKRVNLEPLRRKTVLILFSSMEISNNELLILGNDSKGRQNRYELVWIPIVDPNSEWTEPKQKQFESLQESMPWYSVYHPSLIVKPVISFIKREWKYKNKPIIVVLDPQGRVSSPNAIHMMWIWGSAAYPFTSSREETLWKEATWTLRLLAKDIDDDRFFGPFTFLYGGDDPEWVRRFVKQVRREAKKMSIAMVYVGKSNKREQVQKIIDTIIREDLNTRYLPELNLWFFWTRLQSMLFSKLQLKQTDEDDHVMKEIMKLLSYDKHSGWFLLARQALILVSGHARDAKAGLQTLLEYAMWKENIDRDGFGKAFKNHYDKIHSVVSPCCRIEFSHTIDRIPGQLLTCPECLGNMHVLTTFQCCHDEKIDEDYFAGTFTPPSI